MAPIKKMRILRFGGKEVLQADTIEPSLPDAGQVLVVVHAASVNPVDFKIRSGKCPAVKDDRLPYSLGREFSDGVEKNAVGERVEPSRFSPLSPIRKATASRYVM